jgi:hypothetical protein
MAIAVKRELSQTRYAELIRTLAGEGRTGIKLTCPQGGCRQEYVVYFGSVTEEEEMRLLFDRRVGQHHPCHLDLYAFDEPMPRWAETAEPLIQADCDTVPAFDVLRSMRQKMRLRRALPAKLVEATTPAGLLTRTSRVFAGCLAFVVAAVPIATRTSSLFGPK